MSADTEDAPKRGRPTLEESERLTAVVHIRCHPEDKSRWVKQAQKEGKKLSQWITERLG